MTQSESPSPYPQYYLVTIKYDAVRFPPPTVPAKSKIATIATVSTKSKDIKLIATIAEVPGSLKFVFY
jgi:hypothetical protein